jgi:hypothetical protein
MAQSQTVAGEKVRVGTMKPEPTLSKILSGITQLTFEQIT